MHFIMPELTVSTIISILLALIFIVEGIIMLATGKVFGNYERYTAASVKKFARPSGVVYALLGAIFTFLTFFSFDGLDTLRYALYGACLGLIAVFVILSVTILKKK